MEVEQNPEVALKRCPSSSCGFIGATIHQHLSHQRIHEGDYNFCFVCPLELCNSTFRNFKSLNSHISYHDLDRNQGAPTVEEKQGCICQEPVSSNKALILHCVEHHFKQGQSAQCPLQSACEISRTFGTLAAFRSHCSAYHPGWRDDTGMAMGIVDQPMEIVDQPDSIGVEYPDVQVEIDQDAPGNHEGEWDEYENDYDHDYSDASFSDAAPEEMSLFDEEQIACHIGRFYAMLEGKLLIPTKSIQIISEKLTFLSEIFQLKLKESLRKTLNDIGVSDENISLVTRNILSDDVLYNVHHKATPGFSLSSIHLRKAFYKRNLQYVEAVEDNLKIDPNDRSAVVQYVPIKETLNILLKDPTIQREVDLSFSDDERAEPNVYKNYTDGKVFKKRNVPSRRIDLILFQDAMSCTNPLGSAKKKHKVNGVYMTLGNIRPPLRSMLRAKRLVILCLEDVFAAVRNGLEKSFRMLIEDLKDLETNGIMYKNGLIPVYLQFLTGDNLGQHIVGGFMGGFTADYFCRFCTITKSKYAEDKEQEKPVFRMGKWRNHQHYMRALQKIKAPKTSFKGIKKNSVFNQLQNFKVCDPGMPPCIGHDLFIGGVVDVDLAAMVQYFVQKKEWFSYDLLNRRIKDFKCQANDAPNKPAPVHLEGKKLGGHAVQNWTLLRLLPFIIGDKIGDVQEPVWRLYLLLKKIIELVCAPALTGDQIDEMEALINKYMADRKILPNNYKPKHHYFHHFAKLYRLLGPLIHLWTLGFEHVHQFFKRVARNSKNFINLTFTLAYRHQLMQAHQSTGLMFPHSVSHSTLFSLLPEEYSEKIQDCLRSAGISDNAMFLKKLTFDDVTYKNSDWLLLSLVPDEEDSLYVGEIKLIIYENTYQLIVKKCKAVFCEEYGLFQVNKGASDLCVITLNEENLENPRPHAVYSFKNKKYISLKHALLEET